MNHRWKCAGLAPAIGLVLVLGCEDEAVDPPKDPVLEGRVETMSGEPIRDAHIGIMYQFPISPDVVAVPPFQSARHATLRQDPGEVQQWPLRNRPNPFERTTWLEFAVLMPSHVTLTILDDANTTLKTLADRLLPAGRHGILWDGRTESGQLLPPGVYIARLKFGEGTTSLTHDIRMFIWTADLMYFQEAYLTTSGADGRFSLPLRDLPIGEMVPFWSDAFDSLGSQPVLSTIKVVAVADSAYAWAPADVANRQNNVSVTLRIPNPAPSGPERVRR